MAPFVKISLLFIVGILLCSCTKFEYIPINFYWTAVITIVLFCTRYKSNRILCSTLISCCFIILGIVTHLTYQTNLKRELNDIDNLNSQKINCKIEISEINKSNNSIKLKAKLLSVGDDKNIDIKNKIDVIIYTDELQHFKKDRTYLCPLKLSLIKPNKNPHCTNFKKIYNRQNVFYTANFKSQDSLFIKEIEAPKNIFQKFKEIQTGLSYRLDKHLNNYKNASIVNALVLGDKSKLSKDVKMIFKNTGSIHILAVSGLHVGLIYSILLFFMYWFPKNKYTKTFSLILSLICIASYCMITGASTSVIRASLMLSIFLIGKHFGKFTNVYNIIGCVAFIILLINPNTLYTVSFQFSFLALISIIFFNTYLDILPEQVPRIFHYLFQLIIVSISAQILIAPILIYYFKGISLYFWLSGIVAIPLAFLILITTTLLIALSVIGLSYPIGICTKTVNVCTDFLYNSMAYINNFSNCSISNIYISEANVVCCYLCILSVMIFLKYKSKWVIYLLILSICASSLYCYTEKIKSWHESELIVYHFYEKSHITFSNNGILTDVLSKNLQQNDLNNLLFNYLNKKHLKYETNHITVRTKNILFEVNGKVICINPDNRFINTIKNIDFLILTENQKTDENYFSHSKIQKVILDGNINHFNKKSIIQQLDKLQIDCHETAKSGAFIYKF